MINYSRIGLRPAVRERILERDAFICAYCDGLADCVDHVVPWSWSKNDEPLNLVASCSDCNLIAGDRVFDDLTKKREFIRERRYGRKWKSILANRFSVCTECRKPFSEGRKGATHFICQNCYTPEVFEGCLSVETEKRCEAR